MSAVAARSRSRASLINLSVSFGVQIVNWVLAFVARMAFIKILGVEVLGINAILESILIALSLADLGFGTAVSYSLYKPLAEHDHAVLRSLLAFYRTVYRRLALAIAVAGVILLPFLPYIITTKLPPSTIVVYYLIMLTATSASYLFSYKITIITADQQQYIVKLYEAVGTMVRVGLQIMALLLWQSYAAWLVIYLLSVIGVNVALVRVVYRRYPFLRQVDTVMLSKARRRGIMHDVKSLFLYRVSGVVINTSDNIIGSMIAGVVAVGLYANYGMVVGTVNSFIQSLLGVLTPSVGHLTLQANITRQYEVFRMILFVTSWLVGMITVSMMLSLQEVITLWLGPEVLLSQWVGVVVVLNFYFQATAAPLWSFRDGAGIFSSIRFVGIYMAIANVVLSIVFGMWWGIGGVLLATLVARLGTVYWMEPRLLYRQLFTAWPAWHYFARRLAYAGTSLVGLGASWYLNRFITLPGVFGVIVTTLLACGIVSGLFALVFWRSAEMAQCRRLVIRAVKSDERYA